MSTEVSMNFVIDLTILTRQQERKAYMSASERPQPAPVQPQPWCPPVLPNQGPSIHYPAARHPVPSDSFAERFSRTTIDASSPARRGFDDVLKCAHRVFATSSLTRCRSTPLSTPPQYHQGYASTAAADAGRHARRAYQVQHLEYARIIQIVWPTDEMFVGGELVSLVRRQGRPRAWARPHRPVHLSTPPHRLLSRARPL
jgi:hypothetical protein